MLSCKSCIQMGGGIEEEPEWMEFGPSDRSEVIELRGLEEHEGSLPLVSRCG